MTPFEYVIVLISILLGLGITQIVTGIADLVHQWDRVKIYWPHLFWIIIIFFLQIQEWWATYELRNIDTLGLPTFLYVLFYPIILFILARLLFPINQSIGEVDLKEFYFSNYRKFFLWAVLLPLLSFLNNIFITGHSLQSQIIQMVLVVVFAGLLIRRKLDEWVHQALAVILLVTLFVVLGTMWNDSLRT